jgi:hypothetical protein
MERHSGHTGFRLRMRVAPPAIRQLARAPGFAATVVLALAVGLGVIATVFLFVSTSSCGPFGGLLDGVAPNDGSVFGGVTVLIFAIAFAACWLPARHAKR